MNIDHRKLIELVDRPVSDSGVQTLLAWAGVSDKKLRVKRGDSDTAVDAPRNGMVFNFEEADDSRGLAEGVLVLSAVHAMADGVENHVGFKGELPLGLSFRLDRAAVQKLLGKPDWSSPVPPIYRGSRNGFQLLVEFFDGPPMTIASVVTQRPR
jgi:hypothetical protein